MHHSSETCSHHASLSHETSASQRKIRLLWIALSLILIFSLAEMWMSWLSHSLALLAEASHLIADSCSLGIALVATWIAQKANVKTAQVSNQPHRAEMIAALINGIGLMILAGWITVEALERIQAPPVEILSLPMLGTATVGLLVNGVNIKLLHGESDHDLNLKGAFLHILADTASSIGVILAAIAVWWLGWNWADWGISFLVAGFIFLSAIPLILDSLKYLRLSPKL